MKKEKLNPGHYHEALDRCDCVNQIIDEILLKHPAIAQTPAWRREIEKAQGIIADVYQAIGQKID